MHQVRIPFDEQRVIITSPVESDVEYRIEEGARATIISVINADDTSVRHAYLAERASVEWFSFLLAGKVAQEIITFHEGRESQSQHHGVFFGTNHDRFIMQYWSEHTAENTVGHILTHGVLFEQAYSDFKGNIRIHKTARHTDASLIEQSLLLGNRARSDSVPQLEIATNDVQARHSSSMTRIDEEQLFYLTSRGVEHSEAQRLIVRGFLAEIIDILPDDQLQKTIWQEIEDKLSYVT